jgi:adenylate cyclase
MTTENFERKLAAIFYADVAGYSRLTGADEEGTHRRLSEYLDVISAAIKNHRGRVVHYAGDAVLADFSTVTDALSCAAAIQEDLANRNRDLSKERQVQFRIGVNLGEVIVDRDDIYGDGVNVAARLESLADPGGICISGAVYDAIGNKLPALHYAFMGEQSVKNIAKPVRAYRVVAAGEADRVPPACPYSGMVPGGTQIVMGVLQATLNVLDHTITMTKAVIVFSLRTRR